VTGAKKKHHTFETIEKEAPGMSTVAVEGVRDEIMALGLLGQF
jgi:hypothetical protein